jgi:hypothetical protein
VVNLAYLNSKKIACPLEVNVIPCQKISKNDSVLPWTVQMTLLVSLSCGLYCRGAAGSLTFEQSTYYNYMYISKKMQSWLFSCAACLFWGLGPTRWVSSTVGLNSFFVSSNFWYLALILDLQDQLCYQLNLMPKFCSLRTIFVCCRPCLQLCAACWKDV